MPLVAVGQAVDEAVGVEGVLDGEPLAQELRVPHQVGAGAVLGEQAGQALRRAHGDGRLPGDHVAGGEVGQETCEGRVDVRHVGRELVGLLRGAHAQEVHPGARRSGEVGGEGQATGVRGLAQQLGQPRLEEGGVGPGQRRDAVGVDVDPHDLVTQPHHARRVDRAEVAAPDDRDPHTVPLRRPTVVLPSP